MPFQANITYRTLMRPDSFFAKTITRPYLLNRMPGTATVSSGNTRGVVCRCVVEPLPGFSTPSTRRIAIQVVPAPHQLFQCPTTAKYQFRECESEKGELNYLSSRPHREISQTSQRVAYGISVAPTTPLLLPPTPSFRR